MEVVDQNFFFCDAKATPALCFRQTSDVNENHFNVCVCVVVFFLLGLVRRGLGGGGLDVESTL